jgi:NAD(P)-dependent dehydrogenase (short-subunit alcohol dehydrogenase family)
VVDPGSVVMITGAAKGIGQALTREASRQGAKVLALVRNAEDIGPTELLGREVTAVVCDVTSDTSADLVAECLRDVARVDLLVNNAGIVRYADRLEVTGEADVRACFEVHCLGALRVTKAVLPWLRRSDSAAVVNVTSRMSLPGFHPEPGQIAYAYRIGKAAQNMFTTCLHEELGGDGVYVVGVDPGQVRTRIASPTADVEPGDAARAILDLGRRRWHPGGTIVSLYPSA